MSVIYIDKRNSLALRFFLACYSCKAWLHVFAQLRICTCKSAYACNRSSAPFTLSILLKVADMKVSDNFKLPYPVFATFVYFFRRRESIRWQFIPKTAKKAYLHFPWLAKRSVGLSSAVHLLSSCLTIKMMRVYRLGKITCRMYIIL